MSLEALGMLALFGALLMVLCGFPVYYRLNTLYAELKSYRQSDAYAREKPQLIRKEYGAAKTRTDINCWTVRVINGKLEVVAGIEQAAIFALVPDAILSLPEEVTRRAYTIWNEEGRLVLDVERSGLYAILLIDVDNASHEAMSYWGMPHYYERLSSVMQLPEGRRLLLMRVGCAHGVTFPGGLEVQVKENLSVQQV